MVQTRSAAKRELDLRRQAIINEATQEAADGSSNTPPTKRTSTTMTDSSTNDNMFVTPIPSPVGPPRTPPPIHRRVNAKTHRTLYSEEISPRMVASLPCNFLEPKLRQQRPPHFDSDSQLEQSPRGGPLGSPFMTPKASTCPMSRVDMELMLSVESSPQNGPRPNTVPGGQPLDPAAFGHHLQHSTSIIIGSDGWSLDEADFAQFR